MLPKEKKRTNRREQGALAAKNTRTAAVYCREVQSAGQKKERKLMTSKEAMKPNNLDATRKMTS